MKRSLLSIISIMTFFGIGLIASSAMAIDGPLANATVSFGQWESDPPLDRIVGDPAAGARNNHELHPQIATIKQGGSVNFIIGGGHVVAVYEDGTQPGDIGSAIEPNCIGTGPFAAPCSPLNAQGAPAAGGILSDSNGRVYRGAFLNLVRRDGVEVVQFSKPGTYLVICARKNHFENDGMFGFVKVLPGK
jgi:hypothetical protein